MLAFLATAAIYVVPFLVIITIIVTIHELGHFLTARAFGVAVDRFSIGFGRAIVSFRDKWGVEWRLAWLPIGGYVRFAGDENDASVPDEEDLEQMRTRIQLREGVGAEKKYLFFKPLWQRALVVAAGPAMNFVLAIVLFGGLLWAFGEDVPSMRVQQVFANSVAASAGVQPGDVVTALDGRRLNDFSDLQSYVQDRPGVPIRLTLTRANQQLTLEVTPGVRIENNPAGGTLRIGMLGISPATIERHYGPIGALGRGAETTWKVVARTGEVVGQLIQGRSDWPFQGFLGSARVTGSITQDTVHDAQVEHVGVVLPLLHLYVSLAALLSVSIGLVNLLPIPVLDGGHLLFYAYEAVARRPLAVAAQAMGYRVGLALLFGLMLFTTWHDLQRMQVFHFLGSHFFLKT